MFLSYISLMNCHCHLTMAAPACLQGIPPVCQALQLHVLLLRLSNVVVYIIFDLSVPFPE